MNYDLLSVLSVLGVDTSRLKVYFHMCMYSNPVTKIFTGSSEDLAAATGTSLSTVTRSLKHFKDLGYITRLGNSKWKINENILSHPDTESDQPYIKVLTN